ncbi:hypothetical protein [Modestobacter sp. I12A-02662]|uniref:hypothetical protein n=1 Tax=Modestobacter sp. I12A-02662 TaxID=1730496 RepID=UPI0034DEBA33
MPDLLLESSRCSSNWARPPTRGSTCWRGGGRPRFRDDWLAAARLQVAAGGTVRAG